MRKNKKLALVVASLFLATLWGCGSNMDSDGDQTEPGTTISDAATVGSNSCEVCHSAIVAQGWDSSAHDTSAAGCEGCHGGGQYHKGVGPIPYPSPTLAAQCSTCHTDAGFLARHAGDLVTTSYQPSPTTIVPTVEGYVLTAAESAGCEGCHGNIHNPVAIEINKAWANSAHAGRIASATPDTESVWGHYDWDASSRASCQRCHTATGISNLLTNPAGYVAANNNFSHLESGQNELLYCWGCHSDVANGTLRNPGPITENYTAVTSTTTGTTGTAATVIYPNAGDSNVCMGCHLGREIGQNITNTTDADGKLSFINSHYLAAGGMVFGEAGYEYAGQDYSKNFLGHSDAGSTDGNGPCVTCHMTSDESHKFEVVTKDAAGAITSVTTTACGSCHGNMNAAWLEERKETFHAALEALNQALLAKGIEFKPAHPYFYNSGTSTAFTDWASVYGLAAWKDVMGAAFNYNLLEHDPGAYTHNRSYALKLIADSIDFLADGMVDGAGVSTINALPVDLLAAALVVEGTTLDAKHFDGSFGGNAMYTAQNASCSDCHAGGVFSANGAIMDGYAESGHGDVTGAAWRTSSSHDWPNAPTCQNCHSTTGFIAKVGGTTSKTPVTAASGQTLACDACHVNLAVDGSVRPVAQVTVVYQSQTLSGTTWTLAPASFPNVAAQNNICITCHAGRESGESIKALLDTAMANVSFKNPHYLGAAGMMYAKLGYNFAGQDDVVPGTTTTYGKTLTTNEDGGSLTSTHRKLGTPAMATDSHVGGQGLVSDGPCVVCHMANAADHTWEINAAAFTNVCIVCHDEEAGTPLTVDNFGELFIEEQAIPYHDAIALAEGTLLAKFNIQYSDNYPYFFDNNLATPAAVKDWTRGGTLTAAQAKNLMGACLNIKLMHADPAAYVHSRTYARRLLYDTIDWLDDKTLNLSTGVTALAWDPAKYVKGATAASPTTESVKYLLKYNRTSLAWDTASERP